MTKLRARDVLLLWVWSALVYGLLEGAALLFFVSRSPLNSSLSLMSVNAHIIWIAPLVNFFLFLPLACAVLLLARWAVKMSGMHVPIGLFSFTAFFGLLLLPILLNKWAAMALAAGLTVVLCRWIALRQLALWPFLRRTLPVAAALWLLAFVSILGRERFRESTAVRNLPSASGRPNVLLVVIDTLRADWLDGAAGEKSLTPHLDRFAGEGVRFTRALAPSSWTLPSHASLFTGLLPHQHGASALPLDSQHATLAEAMAQEGYLTAGFTANTLFTHQRTGLARGFIHYEDLFASAADAAVRTVYGRRLVARMGRYLGYYRPFGQVRAAAITSSFLRWLDANPGRPFFVFLNLMDVHAPCFPNSTYARKRTESSGTVIPIPRRPVDPWAYREGRIGADVKRVEVAACEAGLSFVDDQLHTLFQDLARRGLLDNTIVVVTSDHGEGMFQHGALTHGVNLYREAVHVPLILRFPEKLTAGVRDSRLVTLADLPATLLALSGSKTRFPGADILHHLTAEKGQVVLSELNANPYGQPHWPNYDGELKSLVTDRWHYIRHVKGREELFDWQNDPLELSSLASLPENVGILADLRARLESIGNNKNLAARSTPKPAGAGK